jgi:glutamate synthase (NADPH) small chain
VPAKSSIIYRRTAKEMPARLEEIEHAKEEGIDFQFLRHQLPSSAMNRAG